MKTLPPLASLIAGIKASATPATHRIVSSGPIPPSDTMPKNLTAEILAERKAAPVLAQPTKEDARLINEANDLAHIVELERLNAALNAVAVANANERDASQAACRHLERELAIAGQARKEREAHIASLERELAEARNDRKAEARTLANVYALHFLGPQGTGTADRIKAVGGSWKFHRAAVKDQFAASGFWLMPDNGETNALCADLQAEGKSIRTAPV